MLAVSFFLLIWIQFSCWFCCVKANMALDMNWWVTGRKTLNIKYIFYWNILPLTKIGRLCHAANPEYRASRSWCGTWGGGSHGTPGRRREGSGIRSGHSSPGARILQDLPHSTAKCLVLGSLTCSWIMQNQSHIRGRGLPISRAPLVTEIFKQQTISFWWNCIGRCHTCPVRMCSTGWAYTAAGAIGAVHSWWILWICL